jgi:uncharacterized protein YceK
MTHNRSASGAGFVAAGVDVLLALSGCGSSTSHSITSEYAREERYALIELIEEAQRIARGAQP